jgi:hypothetical protein
VLAVLECRASDDDVRTRALELVSKSGGYLTLVALVPRQFSFAGASPYCVPRVSAEELREDAAVALARAVSLVPPDVPLLTAIEEGRSTDVIRRRVEIAAHDAVVVRRRRLFGPTLPVPVVAC